MRGALSFLVGCVAACPGETKIDVPPGDPCGDVRCAADQECVDGSCIPRDVCADVSCDDGFVCVGGSCLPDDTDADGDGATVVVDCDDDDPTVGPVIQC